MVESRGSWYHVMDFPGSSDSKASVYNAGNLGSIPGRDQEDSLEKEMATHSSTLAWKIPWMEEPGVHGAAKSWTRLSDFTFFPPNTGLITPGPNNSRATFFSGKRY